MDAILSSPAFVIHLTRSTDREKYFKKNILDAGFTDMRIFEAVDGMDVNSHVDALMTFNNPPIDLELSSGQIGCLLSHMKLLKYIIDKNIPLATVFEDDVHFHPEWKTLCQTYYTLTPSNFDLLYIGNGLDSCRQITNHNLIDKISTESVWCTHAYVITHAGAKKVLDSIINWDYKNFHHGSRGKGLNGLYNVDIILKDTQNKINSGIIPRSYIWYSWNGTKYPCNNNILPVTGNNARNTGLVFQNVSEFKNTVCEIGYIQSNNFYDESLNIIDTSTYETTEQWIADTFISREAVVLELGGRYGVVSVHINKKLNNTKNHCVVEPDRAVFKQMFCNILQNKCKPHVFNGVISKTPLFFKQNGTASIAREDKCSCDAYIVPNKSLDQLISETGLKFDTLVADCEGCLEKFIDENIKYLDTFKMITFEEDCHDYCDYEKIKRILGEHKFICIRPGGHSVWTRTNT
jgi:glycosyl transferase family 25